MLKLNPQKTFSANLQLLLQVVDDPEIRTFLETHADDIKSLAQRSTQHSRAALIEAIQKIIDGHAAKEMVTHED